MSSKFRIPTRTKTADEILDFGFDWADWLDEISDTINTSTWTLSTGLTEDSSSNDTTTTTVTISGGAINTSYLIKNKIVTSNGRTAERMFVVECVEYK